MHWVVRSRPARCTRHCSSHQWAPLACPGPGTGAEWCCACSAASGCACVPLCAFSHRAGAQQSTEGCAGMHCPEPLQPQLHLSQTRIRVLQALTKITHQPLAMTANLLQACHVSSQLYARIWRSCCGALWLFRQVSQTLDLLSSHMGVAPPCKRPANGTYCM